MALAVAFGSAVGAPGTAAQQGQSRAEDMNTYPKPFETPNQVWMEELTVPEIRDAIRAGKTTAIILTGGIEQNGPYLVTGKHNYVLAATGNAIAHRLGNALVAPIVTIEPGNPETESSPGGIRLTPETYLAVLRDMATSLKTQGFTNILFMGDSGGNQNAMKQVADELNAKWGGRPARVHYIEAYYREDIWSCNFLKDELKIFQQPDVCTATRGQFHDDVHYSSIVATTDPRRIRVDERTKAGLFSINGVSLGPLEKTLAVGHRLIEYRADITVRAIQQAISSN
jgi:creatinine amidohydrolase/Fe(II)-dependent formamide hydrolase-like protein